MARIRTFEKASGTGRVHPTEVDAEWSIVAVPSGEKLFQISTFGSDERVSKPKVSQTVQLDAKTAEALITALKATFGTADNS